MILDYNYFYFNRALSPEKCDRIIELGETEMNNVLNSGGSIEARTNDSHDENVKKTARNTDVSWLNTPEIYEMVHPFIHEANIQAGWNFDWDFSETMQYTKYGKKQFYDWHCDSMTEPYSKDMADKNFAGKIRKLSVTINLSDPDDYTGGDLKFNIGATHTHPEIHTCKEIRPRGSLVVFPSHVPHTVTPITSGIRRSLVIWSLGPPFR